MVQVRYVVDSGKVCMNRYDPRTGFSILDNTWISKASATQRKGRAGRISSGQCVRLYSEEQYADFDSEHIPEVQRAALDHMILQLLATGSVHGPFMQRVSAVTKPRV